MYEEKNNTGNSRERTKAVVLQTCNSSGCCHRKRFEAGARRTTTLRHGADPQLRGPSSARRREEAEAKRKPPEEEEEEEEGAREAAYLHLRPLREGFQLRDSSRPRPGEGLRDNERG